MAVKIKMIASPQAANAIVSLHMEQFPRGKEEQEA
jgi:hypothetical protein